MIKSVRILATNFTIEESDSGTWSSNGMGRASEKDGLILIDKSMPSEQKKSTAVHEIMHIIESLGGIEGAEQFTCFYAGAIMSLIRDNPKLIKWLQEE